MARHDNRYPILNDPYISHIPWDVIAPHERQAQANHGQTLAGLASRGGLSPDEAYFILKDRGYPRDGINRSTPYQKAVFRMALMRLCLDYEIAKMNATQGAAHD